MKKQDLLYLAGLAEFARTGPKKSPQRLASFLVKCGGLKDWHGEVRHLCGGPRGRPGLINNIGGMHLDEAARLSWERGFIPTDERPTVADLLDYLGRDLGTEHITSADDAQASYEHYQAEEARNVLDSLGILGDSPAKQIRVERALLEYAGTVH